MIKFRCPHCNQKLGVPDEYASRRVRCSKCSEPLTVPAQQAAPTEQPAKPQMKFRCPNCNQKLSVPTEYTGRRVRCSKCSQPATVPVAQPQPVPQPPAAQDDFTPNMWDDLQLQEPDPEPVAVNPNLEHDSEQSQFKDEDDYLRTRLAGRPLSRRPKPKKTKTIFVMKIIFIITISAITATGLWLAYSIFDKSNSKEIEAFADDFIVAISDGDIDAVSEFLSPQNTLSDAQIDEMIQSMMDVKILYIDSMRLYGIANEEASGYIYSCEVEAEQSNRIFLLSILQQSQEILLVNATVSDKSAEDLFAFGNNEFSAMTTELNEIVYGGTDILLSKITSVFITAMVLLLIVGLITTASMWIVYTSAGESGWAIFIPVYNLWVLARIADKPEWFGLLAAMAGMIPAIGNIISFVMQMIISIGVAQVNDKNFLFGIGLCVLPFIFYPLLALSVLSYD